MKLAEILKMTDLINSETKISLFSRYFGFEHDDFWITTGHWYEDRILKYNDQKCRSFSINFEDNVIVVILE